jgi:hypothetical protein
MPPWYLGSPLSRKRRFDTNEVKLASFAWTRWVSARLAPSAPANRRSAGMFIMTTLPRSP